jgi:hypothetical protein
MRGGIKKKKSEIKTPIIIIIIIIKYFLQLFEYEIRYKKFLKKNDTKETRLSGNCISNGHSIRLGVFCKFHLF